MLRAAKRILASRFRYDRHGIELYCHHRSHHLIIERQTFRSRPPAQLRHAAMLTLLMLLKLLP